MTSPSATVGKGGPSSNTAASALAASPFVAGRWQAASPTINAYQGAALVMLGDGRALYAGGFPSGSQISAATVEIFDPASGSWSLAAPMATPRANFSASRIAGGRVLVAGGFGPDGHRTASSEIYDPVTNRWSFAGTMVVGRVNQASSLLADGRLLVVGGRVPTGPITAAEIYDPASSRWTRTADMSTPRESPAATLLADGRVLVTGGRTADSAFLNATETAELFDPATGQWSAAPSMHHQRAYHTATGLSDGRVLVTGGAGDESPMSEIYDPAANRWSDAGATPGDGVPASRNGAAAIRLPNGNVLLTGGYTSYPNGFQAAIAFDPSTGTWSLAGRMVGVHPVAYAALLADGRVLVVGGSADTDLYIPAG